MKQIEKSVLIVLAIILVAVLASGATYIFMNLKNEDKSVEENITLTKEELTKYLSYVPRIVGLTDNNQKNGVYFNPNNLDKINKTALVNNVLQILTTKDDFQEEGYTIPGYDFYFDYKCSGSSVKNLLKEIYNIDNINFISSDLSTLEGTYSTVNALFEYYNGDFYGYVALAEGEDNHISYVNDYKLINNDLVIYEVAAYLYSGEMGDNNCEHPAYLGDYQNNYQYIFPHTVIDDYCSYNNDLTNEETLKENKTNFTEYKHTFKKSDTGYYWYSTEVVEN